MSMAKLELKLSVDEFGDARASMGFFDIFEFVFRDLSLLGSSFDTLPLASQPLARKCCFHQPLKGLTVWSMSKIDIETQVGRVLS